jgi:DNA-binding Lrp family transcriptional regulator
MTLSQTQTYDSQVALTKRDLELLNRLYVHNLLSFGQIQKMFFSGRSHPTVLNRLKRLESAGLILRQRINRIRHPVFNQDIGVVFQIAPKGFTELQKFFPEVELPDKPMALHGRQIDHDLLVVEMAERTRKEFPNHVYVSGVHVNEKTAVGSPRPDGVFINSTTGKWIAIEVELTMKSGDRYRELVAQYRMFSKTERVIYFVSSTTLAKRIMSEIKGFEVRDINVFSDKLFEVRLIEPRRDVRVTPNEVTVSSPTQVQSVA